MLYEEKIKLLKAMRLLSQIPDRQLSGLAEFLRPKEVADGAVVFQEGSRGMSLYFVSSGRVRITKGGAAGATTDLATLNPGDFFGEMALIEEAVRSASAVALGPTVLFELFHGDLARWVKSNPQQAVQFFAELVHLQSDRLRRTSNELTLNSELSSLLFEQTSAAPFLLPKVLERVLPRLDGSWSGAAYLSQDGGAMELLASKGDSKFDAAAPKGPGGWIDGSTYHAVLGAQIKPSGHFVFRAKSPVPKHDLDDAARALTTVARMTAAALKLPR